MRRKKVKNMVREVVEKDHQKHIDFLFEKTGILLNKEEYIEAMTPAAQQMSYNLIRLILEGNNVKTLRVKFYQKPYQ
jgi:hypothetical protein